MLMEPALNGCTRVPVGRVSPDERDQIKALHERKSALVELTRSLASGDSEISQSNLFYEKLVTDMARTHSQFQQWWDEKGRHYGWIGQPGCCWEIDFLTCEVFLRSEGSGGANPAQT